MRKKHVHMYLMLIPVVILFTGLVFYPFIEGIRISLTNWNGYSRTYSYVGMTNYISLLNSRLFKVALRNTFIYGFGCTFIQQVVGLAYALFVNLRFRGRNLVRLIIYLPSMIAGIIMGYMMYGLFEYNRGALNDIVRWLGGQRVLWLEDGNRAVFIIVLINAFQFVGVSMLIYLAGLQNVPAQIMEAARLDGCGSWQLFAHVVLPLLIPAITSSTIINLIGGLRLFDLIQALTSGGPGIATHSIATSINYLHFWSENAGGAAAAGVVLFVIIFIVSATMNTLFRRKEVEF